MVLSDLQIPFEAEHALEWCAYLKRHYRIPEHNVLCVGDEVDEFHGSDYPKTPEYEHTIVGEIKESREKIKQWGDVFPYMRIATSNHMLRWIKKAANAGIPSQLLHTHKDIFQCPPGWVWDEEWLIKTKHPFKMFHGMHLSGKTPYRMSAEYASISTLFGHLHSSPGICHIKTFDKHIWSMNTGCLINPERYAFKYEKYNKFKPVMGCGLVFDEGRAPVWLPYPYEK